MRVLIIEDEDQAAKRMEALVMELKPSAHILDKIDSVKRAVQWFTTNPPPDLVLMDIQLADGISFQIFEQCKVDCPVIFTTAYDEYALKAFKVNSIDYILKPIDKEELSVAFAKLKASSSLASDAQDRLVNIELAMQMLTRRNKSRFVIKVGEHLKTIEVENILYFFSQDKTTFCHTLDKRDHILDYTLDQLEEMLDKRTFFRINRKYVISPKALQDIISYTNSRLRLVLKDSDDQDVIVARERVQEFKDWLDQ